jgi:hypothetical protein
MKYLTLVLFAFIAGCGGSYEPHAYTPTPTQECKSKLTTDEIDAGLKFCQNKCVQKSEDMLDNAECYCICDKIYVKMLEVRTKYLVECTEDLSNYTEQLLLSQEEKDSCSI